VKDLVILSTGSEEYAEPYIESLKAAGLAAESLCVMTPDRRSELPALASRGNRITQPSRRHTYCLGLPTGRRYLLVSSGAEQEPDG